MNTVALSGRLTKDVTVTSTGDSRPYAQFTIAVPQEWKDKETGQYGVDFIDCVAFGPTAEYLQRNAHKGTMIEVRGRLSRKNSKDADGNTKVSKNVVVQNVGILTWDKKEDDSTPIVEGDAPEYPDFRPLN